MKFWLVLSMIVVVACSSYEQESQEPDLDSSKIQVVLDEYVNGWLDDDTSMVLGVFADSAVIVPSGMQAIKGKEGMKSFWFPEDGSTTTVEEYVAEIIDIKLNDSLAYTREKGELRFSYKKEDFSINQNSRHNALTVYQKQDSGEWKIISRIWSDLKQ